MVDIRKDEHGLFAYIGGWICRPSKESKFKESDKVRGSHPAGHYAYLRIGKRNTPEHYMESWDVIDLTPKAKGIIEKMNAVTEVPNISGATKVERATLKNVLGLE